MKIGVLVVAYNAEQHLAQSLDRIPTDFIDQITAVHVCDDASQDNTYEVGVSYGDSGSANAATLPLAIIRRPVNLGYGGNQKAGYRWAIESGLDIVVMLHGDGQYAPEFLPEIVQPLLRGEADAVFGSRMMEPGQALDGGMPRYKYYGNPILTTYQNALAGTDFTEWHSGYSAYSVAALANIPFADNSDGFDFDTEIIVQLVESGARIAELPIRPITATRSATSMASSTAGTSQSWSPAIACTRWALVQETSRSPLSHTRSRRASILRTGACRAGCRTDRRLVCSTWAARTALSDNASEASATMSPGSMSNGRPESRTASTSSSNTILIRVYPTRLRRSTTSCCVLT